MNLALTFPTVDPKHDLTLLQWPRTHRCGSSRDSVLFSIAHAIAEGGEILKVFTKLSAQEFFEYAKELHQRCQLQGDYVEGRLEGLPWKVKVVRMAP